MSANMIHPEDLLRPTPLDLARWAELEDRKARLLHLVDHEDEAGE